MFTQKRCSKFAKFYIAWGDELESQGNTKKADLVYTQGIHLGAEPLEFLRKKHQ